jgi:hypothetical protein
MKFFNAETRRGRYAEEYIIEADRRLSRSVIWEFQRQYFLANGLKAWQEGVVPHYISSNPYLARTNGRIVLGYLRDSAAVSGVLDAEQPVYIVELGAGSGRLAYHFLTRFFPLLKQSPLASLDVRYVMTDFVPEILVFWQRHERFRPWIEAGMLDFALFDAADLRPITLVNSKKTLAPEAVTNPLILIANYFFDSIPQDSFVIEDGQLGENLLTVYSSEAEVNTADPAVWERLRLAYEAFPIRQPYYDVATYNLILEDYEAVMPDTALTFPNVALDCLRFWQGYGGGRNLLLSGDWGYTLAESLVGQDEPLPNMHGSFSLMVNYDAIKQYVLMEDGLVLHPPHYQDNLQVGAYLLGERPQDGLETQLAFSESVSAGGPDDFYGLKTALEGKYEGLSLAQLLSFLRLSSWDAEIFGECYPALLAKVGKVSPAWFGDIYAVLGEVWQGYLPLGEGDAVAEQIGRLLKAMGYKERTAEFFSEL